MPRVFEHNTITAGVTVAVLAQNIAQVSAGLANGLMGIPEHMTCYLGITGIGKHILAVAHLQGTEQQALRFQYGQAGKYVPIIPERIPVVLLGTQLSTQTLK